MSDELKALQEAAGKAREIANDLKSKLTNTSPKKDRDEAKAAEDAAVEAEKAFADAKDASSKDPEDKGDNPKPDDKQGGKDPEDKGASPKSENNTQQTQPDDKSRTGFVTGKRAGDSCTCPDGRPGTVFQFAEGSVCIPNQREQGN
ncbi:hypothetical protein [Rhodopseudomonas palustris]|uniref:hypothetical protein n=1 Tax=Rhodopseudomonas palustris TaxID=1076 RepID=UPI000D1BA258|nr:hypothetical protein [Rhodopseudomonas palustris]AVT83670.1 hypothetical protein RPYSC3_48100 [Rhodopseudomonas palustris]